MDRRSGRRYLTYGDGSPAYFPERTPKTAAFKLNNPRVRAELDGLVTSTA